MDRPSVEQLSAELERLLREQIESLRKTPWGSAGKSCADKRSGYIASEKCLRIIWRL
jgi:hypothetical protein